MSKDFTSTVTAPNANWESTLSSEEDAIKNKVQAILDTPAICLSQSGERVQNLYSAEQMLYMFKLGMRIDEFRREARVEEFKKHTPHYIMRKMKIGDVFYFPFELWDSTRATATYIKKNFGNVFQVKKVIPGKIESEIKVTRIA